MWTKDYLAKGLVKRRPSKRDRLLWYEKRSWLAGDKVWTAVDEWQALYRVEGARRRLKRAREEAAEQRRLVLLWDAQKTREAVAAAARLLVAQKNKEEQEHLKAIEAERWAREANRISAEAKTEMTEQTVWCAWAWANGKKQIEIARELGFATSVQVNQECRRYVLAHYPDKLYRTRWRIEHHGDRHTLIKLALAGQPEPPKPARWRVVDVFPGLDVPPEIPVGPQAATSAKAWREVSAQRSRWVLQQRRAGRTLQEVADALGLGKERIRQMQLRAQEREDRSGATQWLWYQVRATKGLGRPLDIDANRENYRGKWLCDEY